ncbi:hypothetical protein ACH492_07455 [Streptomyces sp. NPDC019443]|uniref:hypothetical protein n=1 Tax=Streptomyces sp. NPDC019443 TaxID=3365061 RepID=UPI0037B32AC3
MPNRIAASMNLHLHTKPFAMCHAYGTERTPILAMQDEHASLTVSANSSTSIAAHLRFARELVAAATRYAAAVETYAAGHSTTEAAPATSGEPA